MGFLRRLGKGSSKKPGLQNVPPAEAGAAAETPHEQATQAAPTEVLTPRAGTATPIPSARLGDTDVPAVWQKGDVILDLYEVTGELGEGSMGKVYKVHHKNWNVDLAVKNPKPDIFAKAGGQENFVREAETWVNLGMHPHIVSCYYVRTLGGIPRVFAEYIEGGSLADWIRSRKLYEEGGDEALARILDVAIQFAWGLDFAHEQGLIHQDVKPVNVMMTSNGTAKATDFGLAKARAMAGEVGVAGTGQSILVSVGGMTRAYCSPEQEAGKPLSRKTDIWSWGLSVLEMFTGEVTWLAGQAAPEVLTLCLEIGLEDPAIPPMPPALAEVLRHCFQIEPEARPNDMQVLAKALQDIYQQEIGQPYLRDSPKPAEALANSLNNRAVSLLDLGKIQEAKQLWTEALQADPHHLDATYNRGMVLWRRGEITDDVLVQQLEVIRASHSQDWLAEYLLGLVHLERGDLEGAVLSLERAHQASGETEVQAALQLARSGKITSKHCLRTFDESARGVTSVSLSEDERWALSGSEDGTLRLWEVATGQCLRTFEGHTDRVTSVSLSKDGLWALSGSWDSTLRLWAVKTGSSLCIFGGHTLPVTCVYLSEDKHLALSGSGDKTVRLWDIQTSLNSWTRPATYLRVFEGHTNTVNSVYLSKDGRWALSGSNDKTIRLWEVATGQCLRTFEGHSWTVDSISVSDDERWVLSGSEDKTVKLWEVATGQCLRTFEGHTDRVTSVSLSKDGHTALAGCFDDDIWLWNVITSHHLRIFKGHTSNVTSVSLSSDGHLALSASRDGTLKLWQVPNAGIDIFSPRLSRPQTHIELFDTEIQLNKLLKYSEEALKAGRYTEALAIAREARGLPGYERTAQNLEVWRTLSAICQRVDLRAAWLIKTFRGPTHSSVFCISTNGHLALGGTYRNLELWELATGRCLRIFEGHTAWVNSISLSADEGLVLSGSGDLSGEDSTLRLWDVATGQCLRIFEGHAFSISAVSLSTDGRLALSGSADRTLRLWDVATGQCLRIFRGHTDRVTSVSLSTDGRLALSGSADRTLRLWDVATGQCLRIFRGHSDTVRSVHLSRDGSSALSGSDDTSVQLWELKTGNCRRTFKGHTREVSSVCLSEDGYFALSGSGDETLRLWNVATGKCLWMFQENTDGVKSISLSKDGQFVISGSWDGNLHFWKLDWELEARDPADWDEGARPYLENFLTLHTPYATQLPQDHHPTEEEITLTLTRRGRPFWNHQDWLDLLSQLQYAGYGWLRPDGVGLELERMARDWEGPPPLFG